jgi:beclin 1
VDESLANLAPSAYDMIAASLPPQQAQQRSTSSSDALKNLNAPAATKQAWAAAQAAEAQTRSPPRAPRTPSAHHVAPAESFVLLQDSVLRTIPAHISAPPPGRNPPRHSKPGTGPTSSGNQAAGAAATINSTASSEPPEPAPLSHHLRSAQRLFTLLSARTDLDHPLCAECTHVALRALERQLEETRKERDGYIAFEREVRKEKEREERGPGARSKEDMEKRIELLKEEERLAIEQLKQAEREREQLEEEMKALDLEEKVLEEEEAEFWQTHNAGLMSISQQTSQLAAIQAAYAADSAVMDQLERTNVYNDAFCIGHDGVFGTINGLRLGRVSGVPVEWAEINAAWGQTLFLLHTIARRLDFAFENHRLVPMGSFSRIERTTGDKASYELYGSGDLHLGRILQNRRFDFAMVAFLECLKQITDYAKQQDPGLDFPHQIVKDKIGEVSVKLQFNQEESWTRALRHVLLALKILLKWTTSGNSG